MALWPMTLAFNAKTLAMVGGAIALTTATSYGLGYVKGANRVASTSGTPQVIESRTERSTDSDKDEQSSRSTSSKTDEDVEMVETKLPPVTLPDGSVEQRIRIQRRTAAQASVQENSSTQAQVKERIVEKRVEIPCPTPVDPWHPPPATAPLPRWMAGPSVARDFSIDKTVFGGSLAVRTGPVFWRVFADSHPQVGAAVEVFW